MKLFYNNNSKGFTLIELLVVISIIGLLSSVVLASLNTVRVKARDSKRIQDLKQIQLALELYKANNGAYPLSRVDLNGNQTGSGWSGYYQGAVNGQAIECAYMQDKLNWIPGLAPTYISVLPQDPKPSTSFNCGRYMYISNGIDYKILAHGTVEGGSISPGSSPFARTFTSDTLICPTQYTQATYAIYSVSLSNYSAGQHPGCW